MSAPAMARPLAVVTRRFKFFPSRLRFASAISDRRSHQNTFALRELRISAHDDSSSWRSAHVSWDAFGMRVEQTFNVASPPELVFEVVEFTEFDRPNLLHVHVVEGPTADRRQVGSESD
jgi:hypothetical protein